MARGTQLGRDPQAIADLGREASILLGHGVYPTGDDALRTARGLLTAGAREALHIDKNDVGPYFAWFWAFDNDTDGAAKYLEILVRNRPTVRAVIDTASATELAAAMYASRYFQGTSADPRENIRAYAARIEDYRARVESALLGWPASTTSPPGPAPVPVADRGSRRSVVARGDRARRRRRLLHVEAPMRAKLIEALKQPLADLGAARKKLERFHEPVVVVRALEAKADAVERALEALGLGLAVAEVCLGASEEEDEP